MRDRPVGGDIASEDREGGLRIGSPTDERIPAAAPREGQAVFMYCQLKEPHSPNGCRSRCRCTTEGHCRAKNYPAAVKAERAEAIRQKTRPGLH